MTPESEQLVRASWEQVTPTMDAVVASFYARLFALSPDAARLFGSTEMAVQRRKFGAMLHEIVRALDHPRLLVSEVADSGRRHATYGVRAEHYAPVGTALVGAIGEALGERATPEVLAAWREAYDLVSAVMRRAQAAAGTQ